MEKAPGEHDSHSKKLDNSGTDVNKRKMLVVDDNATNRAILEGMFKEKFDVALVNDGQSALEYLRRNGLNISVVLLDLMMPGMDGFAVLQKMQVDSAMQNIPVIVVSGMDDRETNLRAIRAGASDFVTKPVDAELLRIRVESAISKAENERLRLQNSYLSIHNNETAEIRTILENERIAFVEYRKKSNLFRYDQELTRYIAGNFDGRPLWNIFTEDSVATADQVKKLQDFVDRLYNDESSAPKQIAVKLKSHNGNDHCFRVKAVRYASGTDSEEVFLLTFTDTENEDKP